MEDRVVEVLRKFPCYLRYNLSPCEEEVIKSFRRFEKPVVQPHMWKFLKEKINDLCVIREYSLLNLNIDSEEVLDIALLTKSCCLKYGIEVKGLPLQRYGKITPKGFADNRDNIAYIGKDFLKIAQLVYSEKITSLFFISFAYKCTFKVSLGSGSNTEIYDVNANKIKNISIIGKLIKEIISECCNIKEKKVGAEAKKLWEYLNTNKSLIDLVEELKEISTIINLVPKPQSNSFNVKDCLNEKSDDCQKDISEKLNKYKELLQDVTIKSIPLPSPDIDLGDNIKIRNFLFVIEPNQPS